ncbi:MAG: hypothetical protein M3394_00070 [Actinomycetota bacterium]|nr:hypothetical protein [Actinomycetota bacterium]
MRPRAQQAEVGPRASEQQRASGHWLLLRRHDIEPLVRADDFAGLRSVFSQLPFLTEEDVAEYVASWSRPGSLAGLLMWARREGLGPPEGLTPARGNYVPEVSPLTTEVRVLAVYGDADEYIRPVCYDGLEQYAPNLTARRVEGAGHWLCEEAPDIVNRHLREFFDAVHGSSTAAGPATI